MKDINFGAFESLYNFYTAFPNEKTCIAYLEKVLWPNGVVSPYDVSSKVYKRGDGYYRCKNTGKNFNVRIGTIFENTKIPLRKWFLVYFVANHRKGISATQLSSDIGVALKTAWFLYDDSISPTLIGVKPSFEDNLFNIHSLGVSFPVPILLLFLQYSINKLF